MNKQKDFSIVMIFCASLIDGIVNAMFLFCLSYDAHICAHEFIFLDVLIKLGLHKILSNFSLTYKRICPQKFLTTQL